MARAFSYLLVLLFVSTSVSAIPVEPRQLGGIGCNVARLKTVAGLRQTTKAVDKLASSSDPAVAQAATTAQGGLSDASAGIKTIAGALLTGQDAPADARDQVAQGLTTAQDALNGVADSDEVQDAQDKLTKTISAGQDVVAKCGGGGAAAAADDGSDDAAANADDGSDAANADDGSDAANADDGSDAANADDGSDAANADDGSDAANADDGSDAANVDDGSDAGADDNSGSDASANDNGSSDENADDNAGSDASTDNSSDSANDTNNNQSGTVTINGKTFKLGNGNNNRIQQISPLRNSRIFGKRQIGGITCNVARLQTVSRLAQSSAAVNKLKKAAASDPAAATAAGTAGTSLKSAGAAIGKIAVALVAGQKAPAAQRDATEKGLNDAMAALSGISSTDPAVTSAASAAMSKVASTIKAGQAVVSQC